ncbi:MULTISPECIES: DUF3107 domain-containing protein [Leucobacter]|uniref:DUF3107 domain-containing protein n=1 Tax=Leucobacter TaxID=55968 RepID=UPI000E65A0D3|nr:DUF3107 domain-containing protein [Leucobacter aridicollis]UTX52173.1 DUF3107 domain-containing protein [Leucobacter aridicollis]
MEVRIGINQSARELSFETDSSAEELSTLIQAAPTGLVSLTDSKGRTFLVNRELISYVELGSDTSRKVGFVS